MEIAFVVLLAPAVVLSAVWIYYRRKFPYR